MEQNKTGKYFKYAIGEIVLVVIGILIALQINNWNEVRKLNNTESKLLLELKEDLEETKEDLLSDIQKAITILEISDTIYQKISANKPLLIPTGYIIETSILFPKKSAYDAIQSKGITIISNNYLRKEITDFYQLKLPRVRYVENKAEEINSDKLKPYLEDFSIPSSDCEDCESLFELFNSIDVTMQNNYIVNKPTVKLAHIIKDKFFVFKALINRYEKLSVSIDGITREIEKELAK